MNKYNFHPRRHFDVFEKHLIDREQECAEPSLPQGLRELYDGDLQFRTPPALDLPFARWP